MTEQEFIRNIATYVQKYTPQFGIKVHSPIIAQACLESGYGISGDPVKLAHNNYFGLKYRENRLTCHSGYFNADSVEQDKDGSYVPISTDWYAFESMEKCVLGYFQFINIKNYENAKGVTDPKTYLENIREDNYSTDLEYVDKCMSIIEKCGLTQYDNSKEENMSIKIEQRIVKDNPCYKANRQIVPKGSMLHSVGCPQPNPEVFVKNWSSPSAANCVHAVVGVEKVVFQLLPWNWRGWHCGSGANGSGNNTLISLEMTEPASIKYTGGATWIETGDGSNTKRHVLATYANAVEFFAYLCKTYGFNPLDSNVILSHHEGNVKGIASNHGDVEHLWNKFGLSMNQFRKDVQKAMNGEAQTTVPTVPVDNSSGDTSNQEIKPLNGTVTIIYEGTNGINDGINIRVAPSITAKVNQIVYTGEVFTVVGISKDEKWYKLKNGLYVTTIPQYVKFKATEEQKASTVGTGYFRVRTEWGKADSQIGAFKDKNNAIELCKQNSGYKVFDNNGVEIYPCVVPADTSFLFEVTIPDLRIRKGAGTTYDYHKQNGKALYTGKGVFTIVKTKEGQGAKLWGLLKSHADNDDGWIALDEAYGHRK